MAPQVLAPGKQPPPDDDSVPRSVAQAPPIDAAAQDAQFIEIVENNQSAVYAYFRARLLQTSDADDLTQEVFVRYYKGLPHEHAPDAVRPFLLGVARNLLRERARKLRRRNEVAWTELCLEIEQNEEEEGRYDRLLAKLPKCLERLAARPRTALELHYQGRQKYQEIARRLERSVGAVKLLMYRARQALKRCLDRLGREASDE
ncbi:MAG: RNA polymerase sigma factor [Planctomycetia bacterium]|nr:RNA polymerase sigma factor [Planctomycetia bacterium]